MPNDTTSYASGGDRGLRLRMASEARRVHSQHEQLATLVAELVRTFEHGDAQRMRSAFEHFADAFDAHMRVEENLYFPALHGLLPEVDAELTSLTDEHRALRRDVEDIRARLIAHDADEARRLLEALASRRDAHEAIEEALIERVRVETAAREHEARAEEQGE